MGSVNKYYLWIIQYPNTSAHRHHVFVSTTVWSTMKFVQMDAHTSQWTKKHSIYGKTCADYSVSGIQLNNKFWRLPYFWTYTSNTYTNNMMIIWQLSVWCDFEHQLCFWALTKEETVFCTNVMDWEKRIKNEWKMNEWMMENAWVGCE